MKKITDVDISGAARRTGLIGPGATVANVSNLRSFLKSLDIPVEDRNPFEKVLMTNNYWSLGLVRTP
jgi:hypothetical protein